jgi:Family of unknown function (DUF5309)
MKAISVVPKINNFIMSFIIMIVYMVLYGFQSALGGSAVLVGLNLSAQGTIWNLPNYIGEIFTASIVKTPVLAMVGGINGIKETQNFEFAIDQTYAHPAASQPSITETASLTAPAAIGFVRSQDKNNVQIHQESVQISYVKMSNQTRLSGIATSGAIENPPSEKDWQILKTIEKIARDVEYSFIQGTYQVPTNAGVAGTTRGFNAAATTTVPAGSVQLSKVLIDQLLRTMYNNGALFTKPVFVVNAFQKQMLSRIYGFQPMSMNVGGVNIQFVETDFGQIGTVLDAFQSTSVLLVADLAYGSAVSQPVPTKGHMFYEELSKTGANENGQIFGQIGLDHGPGFMHGTITGLSTS